MKLETAVNVNCQAQNPLVPGYSIDCTYDFFSGDLNLEATPKLKTFPEITITGKFIAQTGEVDLLIASKNPAVNFPSYEMKGIASLSTGHVDVTAKNHASVTPDFSIYGDLKNNNPSIDNLLDINWKGDIDIEISAVGFTYQIKGSASRHYLNLQSKAKMKGFSVTPDIDLTGRYNKTGKSVDINVNMSKKIFTKTLHIPLYLISGTLHP